jgi:hypothetical protein
MPGRTGSSRAVCLQQACWLLQGKSESDRVEVDVQVLLSAKDELSQQAQLREDLQQVNYTSCCCSMCVAWLAWGEAGHLHSSSCELHKVAQLLVGLACAARPFSSR